MSFLGYWVRPDTDKPDEKVICESCRKTMTQKEYSTFFKRHSMTFFALDVDDKPVASRLCTKCFSDTIRLLSWDRNVTIEIITTPNGEKPRVKHTFEF